MQRDTMGFAGLGFLWLLLSGLILFHFHDQFWWGPDEGVYAYVAQRFLAGDTIHRDLIDIHPGYGNLLNILAFFVFGEDLLSLRYPLVVLTLLPLTLPHARRFPFHHVWMRMWVWVQPLSLSLRN